MERVTVIGAGLAGCEATWQLIKRNIPVRLVEMRPKKESPAFHTDRFAELVCSNSLRSNAMNNAVGILKERTSSDGFFNYEICRYACGTCRKCISG